MIPSTTSAVLADAVVSSMRQSGRSIATLDPFNATFIASGILIDGVHNRGAQVGLLGVETLGSNVEPAGSVGAIRVDVF